jgi:hypothetical protein
VRRGRDDNEGSCESYRPESMYQSDSQVLPLEKYVLTRSLRLFMIHSPPLRAVFASPMMPTIASSAQTRNNGRWRASRAAVSRSCTSAGTGGADPGATRGGGDSPCCNSGTILGENAGLRRRWRAEIIWRIHERPQPRVSDLSLRRRCE